jgi:type IV pilus assembly protein PilM
LAEASPRNPAPPRVSALSERSLLPSPSAPNLLRPQAYHAALEQLAGPSTPRRSSAALVIPDYAVRMAILDFQEFPAVDAERASLLRFRLRKSVPFHIDEAHVSYSVQVQEARRIEVLAVAMARPILEEYEAVFAEHGFRVGLVIPSSLAALPLFEQVDQKTGLTLVAKIAGATISVLLSQQGRLRVIRSLDLSLAGQGGGADNTDAVLALLQQTVAYAEDQLGDRVERVLLCGFDENAERVTEAAEREFNVPSTRLRSKFGMATQQNAGVLGLLEQYAA